VLLRAEAPVVLACLFAKGLGVGHDSDVRGDRACRYAKATDRKGKPMTTTTPSPAENRHEIAAAVMLALHENPDFTQVTADDDVVSVSGQVAGRHVEFELVVRLL
jgi:hypothetical protein